jgi:hypothetical protein
MLTTNLPPCTVFQLNGTAGLVGSFVFIALCLVAATHKRRRARWRR